ncbi:MAG: hypothetical protein IT564_09795 [Rhodospirillales bacterium]|nr:hypothetical protein [Rhodospirillales bacterium]
MGQNPYEKVHPKESLSLELNFRSFLAGEGEAFFEPVPVEDMVSIATLGSPVTIPMSAPYSEDELKQIAEAVRQGSSTLTLTGAARYPADVLERLEKEAPGRIRHA